MPKLCLAVLLAALAGPCLAATITVTGTGDTIALDTFTTLREAITSINNQADVNADVTVNRVGSYGSSDTINFNIAGAGVQTISPTSAEPTIIFPLTLDGYSQAGASANTQANSDNAVILIQLEGSGAGASVDGLTLGGGSGGSTIRGLAINRFTGNGIVVQSDGNSIFGNFVGVDPTGTSRMPNGTFPNSGDGILILNASNNLIGSTGGADRNIASGNTLYGIHIMGTLVAPATGNLIQGNFAGVAADGHSSVGNRTEPAPDVGAAEGNNVGGIDISGGNLNTVGGTAAGARNVVGLNFVGIGVDNGGQQNIIQGNFVGVGADGVTPAANVLDGIILRSTNGVGAPFGPAQANEPGVSFNVIGGTVAGAGNLVEFNGASGITVSGNIVSASGQPNIGNAIEGNSVFENARNIVNFPSAGIDLANQALFFDGVTPNDSRGHGAANAPNNFQNFPVLTSAFPNAGNTVVIGTLTQSVSPNSTFRIEFFASDPDPLPGAPAEGQQFIGFANVTTDGLGAASFNASFAVAVAAAQIVTATATDSSSNTSEFSAGVPMAGPATHFQVTAPATVTAGTAFNFTITALDALNAPTGYSGVVHFTSTDGQAVLPADSTLTNGVGTFSATLKTAGNQTITGTDTVTPSITGTSSAIAVGATAATHFTVSAPASATAGTAFNFTVTAADQFNNTATSYAGTVHFTSSDGASVLPADSTLTNGAGTFSATLQTAGNQTITGTDTVTPSITGTSSAIAVSAAAAAHFTVSAPASATAGTAFNFTITALDALNNTATGYSGTVHFTSTDGQAVLPADSTLTNGVGTFSATLKTAGSQTITGTDTGTPSITGTSNAVNVSAAAATHFTVSAPGSATASTAFNFTVTALDAFSNTVTAYAGTVHFTSSDGASVLPADSTLTNGVGTFSATLHTAGGQTITATDTVTPAITGTSASITVASNNVFSGPSATGTGTITATFTGGGPTCGFSAPQYIGAPPGSPPVPPTLPKEGTAFPQGMFDYSLVGCTVGSTIVMTITYPNSISGAQYWKYGPEASNHTAHWYVMPAAISGNTATFSITDGGQGDDDYTANGVIGDPGGPGLTAAAIPALSQWMLALLAFAMLGIAAQYYARRRQ